jgi:hypothetical protein
MTPIPGVARLKRAIDASQVPAPGTRNAQNIMFGINLSGSE